MHSRDLAEVDTGTKDYRERGVLVGQTAYTKGEELSADGGINTKQPGISSGEGIKTDRKLMAKPLE